MQENSISLIITGGTIDKDYQATTGELVFSETHLPQLLKQANCTLDITTQVVMLKDSLEMTDTDREQILQACQNQTSNRIVITHGTDTMVDTAVFLQDSTKLQPKTIVLTGAMRPYKLGNSDASFNIASALMAAQLSEPGVFISMNGKLFRADEVNKNRAQGIFE
jgi:L-asparaginase